MFCSCCVPVLCVDFVTLLCFFDVQVISGTGGKLRLLLYLF